MQTATMLYNDGHDEGTIVTGLFHDVGFNRLSRESCEIFG